MKKLYYSFKDILFALRYEYQSIQKELDELNKYVLLDREKTGNLKFYLTKSLYDEKAAILCRIYLKRKVLDELIFKFNSIFNMTNDFNVCRINEGIEGFYFDDELLEVLDKQGFDDGVRKILTSSFAVNSKQIFLKYMNEPKVYFGMNLNRIFLNKQDEFCLNYSSLDDNVLSINSYNETISELLMMDLLDMKFPRSAFSEYCQNIIDRSSSLDKDIEIDGRLGLHKNAKFEMIEEPNILILKKK